MQRPPTAHPEQAVHPSTLRQAQGRLAQDERRVEGRIDLHLHTDHSDGTFTPGEVVRRARTAGLSAISITDHDGIGGIAAARQSAGNSAGAAEPLEILSGVELTAVSHDRELHVLGYGFREDDPALNRHFQSAQDRRQSRIQRMIERLNAAGVPVTQEEVRRIAGNVDSIGRPHLAEALVKRGAVGSLNEAFDRYLGDRAPCFVRSATLTVSDAVRLIRQAGGVAVLAHPYRLVEDEWLPELVQEGIQGIEAFHSDHDAQTAQFYRRAAAELGLLVTGGSDCHGFRKSKGPLIGTVEVPYDLLERLKEVIASEAKQSRL